MGIEYTLINYRTKEMIDLGKGCWYEFRDYPEYFLYKYGIKQILEEHDYFSEDQGEDQIIYWNKVVELIFNFVKDEDLENISIVSDAGEDLFVLRVFGFKYVATRYNLNSNKYIERLQNLQELNEKSNFYCEKYKKEEILSCCSSYLNKDKLKYD